MQIKVFGAIKLSLKITYVIMGKTKYDVAKPTKRTDQAELIA